MARRHALIVYVPVLHEGYRALLLRHPESELYIVPPELVSVELPRLPRDLRALPTAEMVQALRALTDRSIVDVLSVERLGELNAARAAIVMPVDEVSSAVAATLPDCDISYENVFLRWDKPISTVETQVAPNRTISRETADLEFMQQASREAEQSGDWWRQIGALAVKDGTVLFRAFNHHHPSEHAVYAAGNPRDNFDAGERLDISPTIHAEASIVAQAARDGVALQGASIYVTTFPCINCARLLAEAGVQKIYYRDGYSRIDAEDVLKEHGVEIILVKDPENPTS